MNTNDLNFIYQFVFISDLINSVFIVVIMILISKNKH
jgi:hypothetical protein